MTVVRDQLFFPQKPPGSRFRFSRTGVQPSPGSSTIELPSAFTESGAYPPDRELPGSPRQCSLPLACRHPKATKLELGRGAHLKTPSSANHTAAAFHPTGQIAKAASWPHLSRVSPALHPPERPNPPTLIPRTQVSEGEGTRYNNLSNLYATISFREMSRAFPIKFTSRYT